MKHTMRSAVLAGAALLSIAVGTAMAAGDGPRKGGPHGTPPPSVGMIATQNQVLAILAERTGKTEAELQQLFEAEGPHGAIESLGLDRDTMRSVHEQARTQVIEAMQAAGLITAEQATKLSETPPPPPPRGRGDRPEPPDRPDADE